MKRKPLLIITGGIFLLGVVSTLLFTGVLKRNTLYVNGKGITKDDVFFLKGYAELPFIKILSGFGANVEWLDNNTAEITYKGRIYKLDLKVPSLVIEGKSFNFFMVPPGSTGFYCRADNREVYIDNGTTVLIMYLMGEKIDIDIDQDKIVYITERKIAPTAAPTAVPTATPTPAPSPSPIPLTDLPKDYQPQQATANGDYVLANGMGTFNGDRLAAFLAAV